MVVLFQRILKQQMKKRFGVLLAGYGIKYGLEFVGVDPLQAGNVVQLIIVLGLTIGWISTYMFRVANKDMTYAKQLKSYVKSVMELWAYHLTVLRGFDVDQPRNLVKSVTTQ